jgi:tetratricopeptide (TPR) repeat protein
MTWKNNPEDNMKILFRQILLYSVLFLEITVAQTSQPSKHLHRKVDTGTILYLFQNKIFASLNTKLLDCQTSFEQDSEEESNVYEAFDVFSSSDPLYEAILNNWVQQYGNTYPPYVARAKYYSQCAWAARGYQWARETTEEQLQEMRRYFSLALEDIKSALTLNSKLDVCYSMMITAGMTVSDDRLMKNALAEALKYHPYGFHVRDMYLFTLTPRWGGSYQEMEEFCEEAEKYSSYNPELKKLRSRIFSDKARVFCLEDNYEEAIPYFTKALEYRDIAEYYAERGDCYYKQERYLLALNDFDKALDLKPNNPGYMRKKSGALYRLNRLSDAQDLIEKASRLDPNDKWIKKKKDFFESDAVKAYSLSKQGKELVEAQRYQDAISVFTEAIRLNSNSSYNFSYRGYCYLQLQRYEEALKDYNEVLIRKRDDVTTYDAIGWIQYHLRRYDEAIQTTSIILKLDPNNSEAYYNRALNYMAKGKKIDALTDARHACSMGYQRACPLVEQLQ